MTITVAPAYLLIICHFIIERSLRKKRKEKRRLLAFKPANLIGAVQNLFGLVGYLVSSLFCLPRFWILIKWDIGTAYPYGTSTIE